MKLRLSQIKGFAFDLDGTIWSGATLLPGAIELIEELRGAGRRIVFVSNNSRMMPGELSEQLMRMGIRNSAQEVLSAVELIGQAILRRMGPVELVALGSTRMCGVLESAGHTVVPLDQWERAKAVAVGVDPEFDYNRLRVAASAVNRGAPLYAVNLDARFPVGPNRYDPGCGALAHAIAVAGGSQPIAVGKPGRPLFEMALDRLGFPAHEVAMVGDSPSADIQGAAALGLRTIWIENPCEPDVAMSPDWSVPDPAGLLKLWRADREREAADHGHNVGAPAQASPAHRPDCDKSRAGR